MHETSGTKILRSARILSLFKPGLKTFLFAAGFIKLTVGLFIHILHRTVAWTVNFVFYCSVLFYFILFLYSILLCFYPFKSYLCLFLNAFMSCVKHFELPCC